jgi:hypothetical protein
MKTISDLHHHVLEAVAVIRCASERLGDREADTQLAVDVALRMLDRVADELDAVSRAQSAQRGESSDLEVCQ